MKPAFYTGASGLAAFQKKMNVIGNNMANVSTIGYKAENVSFQDILYSDMYVNTESNPMSGNGVVAVHGALQFTQGDLQSSNGEFDYAITGSGLFAIEQDGETSYTRDGQFTLSSDGGGTYLTSQSGGYVLDANGQHISVATGDDEAATSDHRELMEQIGVYRFSNPSGLQPISGNRYQPSETSGEPEAMNLGEYSLMPRYLESSGAKMMDNMMEMITAQRAFQLSAKVVQAADEVEQTISGLRN